MSDLTAIFDSPAIQATISIIERSLPYLLNAVSSEGGIQDIVTVLEAAWPVIEARIADLATPVKNIIAALTGSGGATADQIAALRALDAKTDAAFDAALADFNAAHPAAP